MPETHQETLIRYLQSARDALLWKLEGLSEYDVRRPITPTGTNLLGLVKHVASVELGYFVGCFGRELPIEMPWYDDDAEENQDMWATPEESREDIIGLYHLAWEVAAIEDLAEMASVLTELDALTGMSDHGATKSLYGQDPDGIEFEVMWLVPRDAWGKYDRDAVVRPLDLGREVERFGAARRG